MTLCANTDQRAAQQFQVGLDWLGSRGAFDPRVDLSAERPEVDWLAQERLGSALQHPALGLVIALGGDHNNRHIWPHRFCLWQKGRSSPHVDVR